MAALHVIGKNLKLGLVVHRRAIVQQNGAAHHLAIGFLRMRTDNDFALENAGRLIIQHMGEMLATDAFGNRVVDHQSRIDMLPVFEQRCTRNRRR